MAGCLSWNRRCAVRSAAAEPDVSQRSRKKFSGCDDFGRVGHLQKGPGVVFADFNNDGSEDVFEKMGGTYAGDSYTSVLYENPGHGNHWIAIDLEGVQTNRSAFGAKIAVTVREGAALRTICRTVGDGE